MLPLARGIAPSAAVDALGRIVDTTQRETARNDDWQSLFPLVIGHVDAKSLVSDLRDSISRL
jgi:hypothetical protein